LIPGAIALFFASVFTTQCSSEQRTPQPPPGQSAGASQKPAAGGLIGDPIKPVVSVKELMQYMIDPISDDIFDAVYWDSTKSGVTKHVPKTQEDWDRVMTGAVSLAEGIELLKIPRPWTPPGDVNNSTGPNPPELSPAQIQAKLDKDPVVWEAKIQALRNATLEIADVAKKKDPDQLFVAMKDVDDACEACHLEYWYPGDAAAVEAQKHARVTVPRH
jgi:hypothetical protein